MRGSRKSCEEVERLARVEAEDRAVAYIEKFPPDVAFATALWVEIFLAEKWSAEHTKMRERGDTRKVFQISDDDFQRMRMTRDMVPPDAEVDLIAVHELLTLLDGLPPDDRWNVASRVAFRACNAFLGPRQKFHDFAFAGIGHLGAGTQDK